MTPSPAMRPFQTYMARLPEPDQSLFREALREFLHYAQPSQRRRPQFVRQIQVRVGR